MSFNADRGLAKGFLNGVAAVLVIPGLISYVLRSQVLGSDRAIHGSSQAWALVPGLIGQYMRRAFYRRTLREVGSGVVIEFGTLFSKADSIIGNNVYVGPYCHLGLVKIGDGALIAAGAHVPSGPQTHGVDRVDIPIRDQEGEIRRVAIGRDAWIGSNAVVMADVGESAVVAAGAVVVEPVPARMIVGGVPAKILKART